MSEVSSFERERQALKAVISSDGFSRSPHLTKLLTYLCEKYFEGRSAELKEYSIAVDALGRSADRDDTGSAAARVQMHRLRNKLSEYYEHEGRHDPLRIVLKPGVYTPQFVAVESPAAASPSTESPRPSLPRLRTAWKKIQHLHAPLGGLAVALAVAAALVATGFWRHDSLPAPGPPSLLSALSTPERSLPVAPRFSAASGIRILPGSDKPSAVDAMGNIWQGDRYFTGGEAQVTPAALLGLTSDPVLFEAYRRGDFTYKIPISPGFYEVHLYFADFLGPRLDLQPKKVLSDFRVYVNGGNAWDHQSRALTYGTRPPLQTEKVFAALSRASDGYLTLRFMPLMNSAFVNAILIFPTPDRRASPIRIVTQEKPVTDKQGQIWLPDRYFTDGNLVVHGTTATGTSDPELLAGERNGNFQYIFPVAESIYTVNLYFVETWFGKGQPGGGGIGSRVFQVDCNSTRLLSHFDILAEAGAPGRVLVKTFHGITPDEDGHIVLAFTPIENHASVNAIEITDEGGASHTP